MSQCRPCRAGQSQRMKRPDRSCWSYGSTCYKQEKCLVGCESQTVIRLFYKKNVVVSGRGLTLLYFAQLHRLRACRPDLPFLFSDKEINGLFPK